MSNNNGVSKIDAVKELLFGQNMQEYDARFAQLKELIQKSTKENQTLFKSAQKELIQELQKTNKELAKRIEKLETKLQDKVHELKESKVDRQHLSVLLNDLASKL